MQSDPMQTIPLVVDLDGTLIHSDLLHESSIALLRMRPWDVLLLPVWMLQGKARLKKNIAKRVQVDVSALPYNEEFIEFLKLEKHQGRRLILCTASHESFAQEIAAHLGIFDDVLASNGQRNLAGRNKAQVLLNTFGEKGFDYAGNSSADKYVWAIARHAYLVNGSQKLHQEVGNLFLLKKVFPKTQAGVLDWLKAIRLYQWVKNFLLFIPVLAAHQGISEATGLNLMWAFWAFGCCASFVYLTNDLFDLESDRKHPRKKNRPFASGVIPLWQGVVFGIFLLIASVLSAYQVGGNFVGWLVAYFVITSFYSWGLKKIVLLDCLILAILYTLRIVAGGFAVGVPVSFWLLAFSIFLFLSLAFVKRYAELMLHHSQELDKAHGRGYYVTDAGLIQQLGVTSGYAAVLVLALYLNSENVIRLYKTPEIIWGAIPAMLMWLSWMWLQAQRKKMHDDPIVFAIKDKVSIAIGLVFVACFLAASL